MTDAAQVAFKDDDVTFATWRNVFFEMWFGQAKLFHFEKHLLLQRAFAARINKFATFAYIASPKITRPQAHERALIDARIRELNPHMAATAVTIIGSGMARSMVRGILSALMVLARDHGAAQVFGDATEATEWLAGHAGQPLLELSAIVQQLRR
jgi:hypothetical protein